MDFTSLEQFVNRIFQYQLFQINQTWITPSSLIMFIVMILLFFAASRLLQKIVMYRVFDRFKLDKGTKYNLNRIIHYLIMIMGGFIAFQFIGIDLSGLAVIFGLLSVGIGFGLQNIASNFVSGLILLFERPIKIGDRVTVGTTEGDVAAINMRSTTIRSLNNITIIVPNSEFISTQVINWSHGDPKIRLDVEVGVSYQSNLEDVIRSLREVALENSEILKNPAPEVLLMSFGDSSWNMQLRVWLKDPYHYYVIRSRINMEIVHKFRANNIEIPFPQRDIHLRSAVSLPVDKPSN
ncbi:MAG: mechanosensitive ion channel family protein [Calditrichaeota bacterium]|nr:mechanosensitive ion channel [Calditrichota bacterium]RQV98185.1 MAG: mechanosensitive ion channel family protein [Calditrichota bacterium]